MRISTVLETSFSRRRCRLALLACPMIVIGLTGPAGLLSTAVAAPPVKFVVPDIVLTPEERATIDQALPEKASATPQPTSQVVNL